MSSRSEAVLLHLIERIPDLGRTQLVKLVYLADLEARRQLSRQITEAPWIYHHHGPYWKGFPAALAALRKSGKIVEDHFEFFGGESYAYRTRESRAPTASDFTPAEQAILTYIVREFGKSPRSDLLEVVYETQPMKAARKGSRLPMASVNGIGVAESGGVRLEDVLEAEAQLARGEGIPLEELRRELRSRRVAAGG